MMEGVVQESAEGTPQGGPLSPLLANIYLDPLDKELEKRGLAHVRYADDCNIYVSSEAAAQRVLASVTRWIEKHLRLRINQTKSGAGPTQGRKLLGFILNAQGEIEVARQSIARFKEQVRELWAGCQSQTNLELRAQWNRYVRGWSGYYRLAQNKRWLRGVEGWIRRHIRKFYWQRWHSGQDRLHAFKRLGLARHHWASARSSRGAWHMAATPALQQALSNARLTRHGFLLPSMLWAR